MVKKTGDDALGPGEYRVSTPYKMTNSKTGKDFWRVEVRVRVDARPAVEYQKQGRTRQKALERARMFAEHMLSTKDDGWTEWDDLGAYADEVAREAIQQAALGERSREDYLSRLGYLLGDCEGHTHTQSLRGRTIKDGTRYRSLESTLRKVRDLHGWSTAKLCRTVLRTYVIGQLRRDELLAGDPLAGVPEVELLGRNPPKRRGGLALSRTKYETVLEHLLGLDPGQYVAERRQGRWSYAVRLAGEQGAIDLTLLQAATGLRISEARQITWEEHVEVTDEAIWIHITEDISKTGKTRTVPVLRADVAQRIIERGDTQGRTGYVVGQPSDPQKVWEARNCRGKLAGLYEAMAEELGIKEFRKRDERDGERSHVWRTTLNGLFLEQGVPQVIRAAYFGHEEEMNRRSYTDVSEVAGQLMGAAKAIGP